MLFESNRPLCKEQFFCSSLTKPERRASVIKHSGSESQPKSSKSPSLEVFVVERLIRIMPSGAAFLRI